MATEIANAYVSITTKMPNIKADLTKALGGSDASSALASSGSKMGSFLTGAIGGAAALGLSKVVSSVMGSINGAIARVDTMNNFPKIMANLGYSAGDAQKSIDKMSKSLTGLPTSLDSMAGMVQQLAPLTGGLGEATDLSLALNNALLAGGKSTEIQANAMEQYVQMLAVGKVDMTAWRSIVSAMPGQVDQLAQSLLGAGAGQNDLYNAMQNGTISFDQFNAAVLDLNKNGLGQYASFADQAKSATDGIATSQANLDTALTRGIATLIQKFQPAITAVLGALTVLANDGFKALGDVIDWMTQNADILIPVIAGLGAALLTALAPSIWAAVTATWAFTAALLANPITWIVLAIGALVAAIVWLAQNWDTVTAAIAAAMTWVWETILKPIFDAIAAVFEFIWTVIIKPIVDLIVNYFRFWGAVAMWLWQNVLSPVFQQIAQIVSWVWASFISPIFAAIGVALGVLGDAFSWLWANIIQPVWQGISDTISTVWNWIDQHVFTPFKTGIGLIGTAFENVAKAIGTAWDGIKKAAAVPINFVLDTVWNNGLRSFWNDMVGTLGLDDMKLPKAPLVKFASGGVMPGYTPGRDVHKFWSPTGGGLELSGGEAIMRPEFTRLVGGAAGVDALNAAARKGHLPFGDGEGNFFGDMWDNITKAASVAWEFLTNPAQAIQSHVIDGIIRPMMGDQNIFGKTVGGLAEKTLMGFVDLFKSAAPSGVGTVGMGWEAMWQIVQNAIPGVVKTSDFRPGAKTVNGGQSYHGMGRAIDLVPASMDTFNAVARLFPNASELIYSPAGSRQLLNGKPFNGWSDAVRRQHYNHVHLAMANGGVVPKLYDQGGWLPDGGVAVNKTGKPEAVLTPAQSDALINGGFPRELVIVDTDRQLIGRMQVEADGRAAARGDLVARGARNRKWADA